VEVRAAGAFDEIVVCGPPDVPLRTLVAIGAIRGDWRRRHGEIGHH